MTSAPMETSASASLADIVACPACEGAVDAGPDEWRCGVCGRQYPVRFSIPDLRLDHKPAPAELDYAREIHERAASHSFQELMAYHFERQELPDDLHQVFEGNELANAMRGRDRMFKIRGAARMAGLTCPRAEWALDIGCGTGSGIAALAGRSERVVGLDYAFTDLLFARKFLDEAGWQHVCLVCASASAPPFRSEAFDVLNATDVIEHLPDQEKAVRQMHRVLRAGGVAFLNSPNRFNVFSPEPHVRLRGLGFLPRSCMDTYVRWRRGRPYTHVRLLSVRELRAAFAAAFGDGFHVYGFMADIRPRCASFARRMLRNSRVLRGILNTCFWPVLPQYHVIGWRS